MINAVRHQSPFAERMEIPLTGELLDSADERLAADYRMISDDLSWSTVLLTVASVYLHRVRTPLRMS